jgi:hypothetical protein
MTIHLHKLGRLGLYGYELFVPAKTNNEKVWVGQLSSQKDQKVRRKERNNGIAEIQRVYS